MPDAIPASPAGGSSGRMRIFIHHAIAAQPCQTPSCLTPEMLILTASLM